MVAALLHDIGKGSLTEHSVAGEPIARSIATRMGFDESGVELIALLVRWHLLLAETATTRDPDDPATVDGAGLAARLGGGARPAHGAHRGRCPRHLAQGLVVVAVRADPRPVPPHQGRAHQWRRAAAGRQRRGRRCPSEVRRGGVSITVEPVADGSRVTVIAPDRVGLLADVAAMFALQRIGSAGGPGLVAGPVRRLGLGGLRGARGPRGAAAAVRRDPGGAARPGAPAGAARRPGAGPDRRRTPRGLGAGHGAGGAGRGPAGRGLPGLRGAGPARRRGPLRARRHARAAGRRRVLPAGGRRPARSATSGRPRPPTPSARR